MPIVTEMNLLKIRRTKIIATLGPASDNPATIRDLVNAGAGIFRLNMSHGTHEQHQKTYAYIKQIARELGQHVGVLADLCGPKIRTGSFENGQIELENDSKVVVTTRDVMGKPGLIPSQYKALAADVKSGNHILINDGNLELRVDSVTGSEIHCTVLHGGILKDRKGINLPGVNISAPSMTTKDYADAIFAMDLGVEYLALSFVRKASDLDKLRLLIEENGHDTCLIAKIEKPEALAETTNILDACDAIMVARGDLGVELLPEQVPVAQSELIHRARHKYKPVIVATQMLESMIDNPRPTRAEVTDISNAVTQGADAVMLSAESAAGAFPVESVGMMDRIIRQTEAYMWKKGSYSPGLTSDAHAPNTLWTSVSNAVNKLASDLSVHGILVLSESGMSAVTISSARPAAPVVAITPSDRVCRKLALMWGVVPVLQKVEPDVGAREAARQVAKDLGLAKLDDHILLVRGFHNDPKKNSPSVTVISV